jgi:O-antigen/teichoic acid export membrane protein
MPLMLEREVMAPVARSVSRRLAAGISGQAFVRVAGTLNSLALVPVLIRAWGLAGYGQWIALTALASYLGYSNFGLVTTSSYDMIMASGAGDEARARRTFQMSLNLIFYVIGPVIALCTLGLCLLPSTTVLHLSTLTPAAAHVVLCAIGLQIWLQTLRSQMSGVLVATGRYGASYYLSGAEKLVEVAVISTAVIAFHGSQIAAALSLAGCTAVDLLAVTIIGLRRAPWARPNFLVIDYQWLRIQAKPTLGYLLGGLAGQGIMLQGPRVILSALLGGTAVAVFSVYGTLMRILDQLVLMLVLPAGVEISNRVGAEDYQGAYRLILLGSRLSLLLFLVVASGMMVFGPFVMAMWTRGHVEFAYGLMGLFVALAAASHLGKVSWYALTSANRLYGLSFWQLGCAVSGVGLGAFLASQYGLKGMVVGCILGELANSIVVVFAMSRWLNKSMLTVLKDMADLRALAADLVSQAPRVRHWLARRPA